MTPKPEYFEAIRLSAEELWNQLESSAELAGPWHQLFKQVQSPRHVLSELLQNADDAGATEAEVQLLDNLFLFSHNGEDFKEEHFRSLCRFGCSNKRALHTIGFRGIGFKSTFSLGEPVRLSTPTLQVAFRSKRFSEPVWSAQRREKGDVRTHVSVALADKNRRQELVKNLDEWKTSPVSLLFFRSIRKLTILGETLEWRSEGQGPVANSEWLLTGSGESATRYLHIWSEEVDFPPEALEEIRQERLVLQDEDMAMPACRVELVLGTSGRLFVVLPTGVRTQLPFACNAPFVQDPARVKIKDPEISPTNQWLLRRIGELAAEALIEWVADTSQGVEERVGAYALIPAVNREDSSLEGSCGTAVEEAFEERIREEDFLLTLDGGLCGWGRAVSVPAALYDVWPAPFVTETFAPEAEEILHPAVDGAALKTLTKRGFVESLSSKEIFDALGEKEFPKPATWRKLLVLWGFVQDLVRHTPSYYHRSDLTSQFRLHPVQSDENLHPACEVVRLGEKQMLRSEQDWQFLAQHLVVLNPNWLRFITEQRRVAAAEEDSGTTLLVEAADRLLQMFSLSQPSDVDTVAERITSRFFFSGEEEISIEDCVRFTRILAKLNARVPETFQYVNREEEFVQADQQPLVDLSQNLDRFIPPDRFDRLVLHDDYLAPEDDCCPEQEWHDWLGSSRSRLRTFPPVEIQRDYLYGKDQVRDLLARHTNNTEVLTHFRRESFVFEHHDFDKETWKFWEEQGEEDEFFWCDLLEAILDEGISYWKDKEKGTIWQLSQQYTRRVASHESLPAGWVQRFRELRCLRDVGGLAYRPADLLCRTAQTEALINTEVFVSKEIDTEANRPLLLLLGVGTKPSGPERLLDQLRAHLMADPRNMEEVDRIYRALDRLVAQADDRDLTKVAEAFQSRALVLAADGSAHTSGDIYINPDEDDAPGAAVVEPAFRFLNLWRRLGIPERPTFELALEWLRSLPTGERLTTEQQGRVSRLLGRYPEIIWARCHHWLTLSGQWAPVDSLTHSVSMQTLVPFQHLFEQVRSRVADFRRLSAELQPIEPFNSLPPLGPVILEQLDPASLRRPTVLRQSWMRTLGRLLARVQLASPEETERIRDLARTLAETRCLQVPVLRSVPYLDHVPAGPARDIPAAWSGTDLYLQESSRGARVRSITEALDKQFAHPDVLTLLKLCFERDDDFIHECVGEYVTLADPEPEPEPEPELVPSGTEQGGTVAEPHAVVVAGAPAGADAEGDGNRGEDGDEGPGIGLVPADEEDIPADDEEESAEGGEWSVAGLPEREEEAGLEEAEDFEPDADEQDEVAGGILPDPEEEEEGEEAEAAEPAPRAAKPARAPLMERYARANGFVPDDERSFRHPDGRRLVPAAAGGMFAWELLDAGGTRTRGVLPREHCLMAGPMELNAEFWLYINRHPEGFLLVLTDGDGEPVALAGEVLKDLIEGEALTLHPASYRLRCEVPETLLQAAGRTERRPGR